MCVAAPMKVVEVGEYSCVAEIDGVRKSASIIALEEVKVGDYIMVHAGLAISKLDPASAEETLRLMREIVATEKRNDEIH
ncbi:MAG: HypC/HybG/HupF family hydrogenase formation chaperone [Nitrospinae bacterium]|nr:HypC/HybG/HupF family hydrogenase formation chaperone [Nitrospinota bacterium]